MKTLILSLSFVFSLLVITACSESSQSLPALSGPQPLEVVKWSSDGSISGVAATHQLYFDGNSNFTSSVFAFSDNGRTQKLFTMVQSGNYSLSGTQKSEAGELGNMDITYMAMDITPLSSGAVSGWNNNAYCGITNWVQGQSRSVVGLNCGGSVFSANTRRYDIYSSSNGQLYFGVNDTNHDGLTPSTRPTTLSTSTIYLPIR